MEEIKDEKDRFIENLEKVDNAILTLRDAYELLIKIFKRYIAMDEEYYHLVACWILGCYFHKKFPSFPFLYLNAMKQSGKTRLLKLLAFLTNGIYTVNITEAVLFRKNEPLFVDEIENITRKEKSGLRELLNVAYKKGGIVERSRKIEKTGEIVIEKFELYRPVAMANIEGMDEVLEDRCIVIVLERCFDPVITRRLEMFELDEDIKKFKEFISFSVVDDDVVVVGIDIEEVLKTLFSYFNKTEQNDTLNINNFTIKNDTNNTSLLIISKIKESTLQGRDLELFLPLFVIAAKVGEDILEQLIKIAENYAMKRKETNIVENRDTTLVGFLTAYCIAHNFTSSHFISLSSIVRNFKELNPDEDWFNTKWLGHALKRLGKVVIEKRRLSKGREVRLNVDLLKEKAEKFGFNIQEMVDEIKIAEEDKSRLTVWEGWEK
ncbi:MAG: hypothetical protein NZ942_03355 [Candidatus Aenigmarchaeota archaeon]|nr:hypothetical protein [Candidatus Aenigmarchaeota archaeon]